MKRGALAVVLTTLVLTSAGTAHAQAAQDKAAAEVLFEEGKELMRQKRFGLACPKFLESNRLDAGLGTILWLADCYEKNGQTASAWGQFREAAEIAARQHDPREKVAHARAVRLERSLAKMTILVGPATAVPGMEVTRDGDKVGQPSWGEEVPVDPGAHKIVATAPHKKPWETTVNVNAGTRNVEVPVPPLEDAPEPVAPPPPLVAVQPTSTGPVDLGPAPQGGGAQRAIGGTALGLGVVGLGFGTYFGIAALVNNNNSKIQGYCNAVSVCSGPGTQVRDTALSDAKASTVFFILGGIVATGGLVTLLTAPSGRRRESVGVVPWVDRSGAGVGMTGAW
jgi:hypothetical protein